MNKFFYCLDVPRPLQMFVADEYNQILKDAVALALTTTDGRIIKFLETIYENTSCHPEWSDNETDEYMEVAEELGKCCIFVNNQI